MSCKLINRSIGYIRVLVRHYEWVTEGCFYFHFLSNLTRREHVKGKVSVFRKDKTHWEGVWYQKGYLSMGSTDGQDFFTSINAFIINIIDRNTPDKHRRFHWKQRFDVEWIRHLTTLTWKHYFNICCMLKTKHRKI